MCLNAAFLSLFVPFLSLLLALESLFVFFLSLTVLFFNEVIHPFFDFRRLYATLDAYSKIFRPVESSNL